jgi:hypothetical protein
VKIRPIRVICVLLDVPVRAPWDWKSVNRPCRSFQVGLALVFTLLNAVKPLQVDDTAYWYYAAHIAEQPLDPYGFTVFWYQWPQPANEVLAPPVLPYWWGLAVRLFGDRPFCWKLWLLPFSLLLVVALARLCHRFARGLERPLLLLTVLSPALLPSLNLMLDVPALALGLFALAVFFEACGRGSWPRAALAGLLAGLALETKYTALLVPAVMLLYAVFFRRIRLAVVAVSGAVAVFAAWEGAMAWRYGTSHFLLHLRDYWGERPNKLALLPPLLADLGGVAPALALLALAALRVRPRAVAEAAVCFATGYLLVAGLPEPYASRRWYLGSEKLFFQLNQATFGAFGVSVVALVAGVGASLRRWGDKPGLPPPARFLVLWLLLEVAGYFLLTPFPAVRRLLGILIVATLLVGRRAAHTCATGPGRRLVWGITAGGVALGLLFYGIDLRDAWAQKEAAEVAAEQVGPVQSTIWYVGHWGFQYYAERAGMVPVVPDESRLRSGDWLVVPDDRLVQQRIIIPAGVTEEPLPPVAVGDGFPLRTVPCFYGGAGPVEHVAGPRRTVRVYRVTAEFVPASPP